MNGGTFKVGESKVRPGIYFNFTAVAEERVTEGARGRLALPLVLNWGEPKKVIEISEEQDTRNRLGLPYLSPSLEPLREARKNAKTVLVYRVNDGEKAKATLGEGTVTAKYSGTLGNDIRISIIKNVVDESKHDVITFLKEEEVDRQTVSSYAELENNAYVDFSITGEIAEVAGVKLEGGTDGTPKNDDYLEFLNAIESEHFDVVALPVDDQQLATAFTSFIRRLRDEQGYKVQGVVANYPANYEGIINVTNGVKLEDGRILEPKDVVPWVAGASAGVTLQQSNTFTIYEGAIDAVPRFDNEEAEERLKKGEFFFTYDGRDRTVSVEQDINSLVTTSKFRKNKIIRILDAINNDLVRTIKDMIQQRKAQGSDIPVNADGEQIVRTAIILYLETFQANSLIQNFSPDEDVRTSITEEGDGFYIKLGVQPIDSAEKFYFDVEAR